MPSEWKLEDKWFYAPLIGFLGILIYELLNYSISYTHYPFHTTTDLNSYIIRLKLLAQYGYHAFVPNINQGIILFGAYPPGWAFFTLPFYYIIGDVIKANFLSLLAILLFFLVTLFWLGKSQGFSKIRVLAFFALFLANPVMIDELFRIGRTSALFGWLAFALFFAFLMYYRERKLNMKFYVFFILLYSILLFAHLYHFLISSLFVAGFFLIRKKKEKLYLVICSALTLLITSNWWIIFSEYSKIRPHRWGIAAEFLSKGIFSKDIILSYATLTSLLLIVTAYFYLKSKKWDKHTCIFFLPFLAFPFLVLTEFIVYIPLFNSIPVNIYNELFVFFSLFFFLGIHHFKNGRLLKPILIMLLILLPIIIGTFVFMHIHDSSIETRHIYTQTDIDVMALIPQIKDPFITLGDGPNITRLDWGYTDYAIIFFNKSAITDDYSFFVTNPLIEQSAVELTRQYESARMLELNATSICDSLKETISKGLYATILSYDNHCAFWKSCGFKAYAENEHACLIDAKSI